MLLLAVMFLCLFGMSATLSVSDSCSFAGVLGMARRVLLLVYYFSSGFFVAWLADVVLC